MSIASTRKYQCQLAQPLLTSNGGGFQVALGAFFISPNGGGNLITLPDVLLGKGRDTKKDRDIESLGSIEGDEFESWHDDQCEETDETSCTASVSTCEGEDGNLSEQDERDENETAEARHGETIVVCEGSDDSTRLGGVSKTANEPASAPIRVDDNGEGGLQVEEDRTSNADKPVGQDASHPDEANTVGIAEEEMAGEDSWSVASSEDKAIEEVGADVLEADMTSDAEGELTEEVISSGCQPMQQRTANAVGADVKITDVEMGEASITADKPPMEQDNANAIEAERAVDPAEEILEADSDGAPNSHDELLEPKTPLINTAGAEWSDSGASEIAEADSSKSASTHSELIAKDTPKHGDSTAICEEPDEALAEEEFEQETVDVTDNEPISEAPRSEADDALPEEFEGEAIGVTDALPAEEFQPEATVVTDSEPIPHEATLAEVSEEADQASPTEELGQETIDVTDNESISEAATDADEALHDDEFEREEVVITDGEPISEAATEADGALPEEELGQEAIGVTEKEPMSEAATDTDEALPEEEKEPISEAATETEEALTEEELEQEGMGVRDNEPTAISEEEKSLFPREEIEQKEVNRAIPPAMWFQKLRTKNQQA